MTARTLRSLAACLATLVALVLYGTPARAGDLEPFLFQSIEQTAEINDIEAKSFQIYRIPLSYSLRNLEEHPWGLRLTFPISLGSHRIAAISDIDEFIARLQTMAIIPGIEFRLPAGERWLLKPFTELSVVRASSGGGTEWLFGVGMRARGIYRAGIFRLQLGGLVDYQEPSVGQDDLDSYSRLEAGLDTQLPLGFSIGKRVAQGGAYAMLRRFLDLEIGRSGEEPVPIRHQYELGLSFSTDPVLALWKLKLPWIAAGYRFGEVFTGWRFYFSFPY